MFVEEPSKDEILDDDLGLTPGADGFEQEEEDISKPFNPSLINVRSKSMVIHQLVQRIREGAIDMTPDFQRAGNLWKARNQSRLIESILINIPLPAFYLDATDEDKWVVVDGLQRLTTVQRFVLGQRYKDGVLVDDPLVLQDMEFVSELEGKGFGDLSPRYKRRITEFEVQLFLIEKGTPPEVKFNIFKRINTGGLALTPQEIRHALHLRPSQFLRRLAQTEEFLQATSRAVRTDRMEDRELVNRFLAFFPDAWRNFRAASLDSFLSESLSSLETAPEAELDRIEGLFKETMRTAYDIFREQAFRKRALQGSRKLNLNKALFEAISVCLAKLTEPERRCLVERRDQVELGFLTLMEDEVFLKAISVSTSDAEKIKKRFDAIGSLFDTVLKQAGQ